MHKSFPPIETDSSRVLILGTMPGAESLRCREYYAFPQNAFWPIMAELLRFETDLQYTDRCEKLREANIALWDVLKSCRRQGSLDSEIRNETPNDFVDFFKNHREIRTVFFNGGGAERLFNKHVIKNLPEQCTQLTLNKLPSTSPANARLRFNEKLELWRVVMEALIA